MVLTGEQILENPEKYLNYVFECHGNYYRIKKFKYSYNFVTKHSSSYRCLGIKEKIEAIKNLHKNDNWIDAKHIYESQNYMVVFQPDNNNEWWF